ncbi:MAG: hypothetical protein JSW11_10200 [Candidatus Heimdallarchaeota archaeon]|nr:MAG: hypothetical protein JSW11_10200 [Candidatus Heimdallarchaeota archaeon]
MLETFLIDQGIIQTRRFRLLCVPDYLFFRTHAHRLYREFIGIPRYSIITRKVTDELDHHSNKTCSLESLYIVDGSSALTNAPFYFPLAKHLDLSIVGTNLDINELTKLRYMTPSNKNFQKYEPITVVSSEVIFHAPLFESGLESNAVTLPPSFDLFLQPITVTKNTIAVGSVREIGEFFPIKFDIMRINLGDFIEYNQLFSKPPGLSGNAKSARKQAVLEGLNIIIRSFNIPIILISLYKISKFFATSSDSIRHQIQEICDRWNFSESVLINNEKRRVWKEEEREKLDFFYDALGYIVLFNRSV